MDLISKSTDDDPTPADSPLRPHRQRLTTLRRAGDPGTPEAPQSSVDGPSASLRSHAAPWPSPPLGPTFQTPPVRWSAVAACAILAALGATLLDTSRPGRAQAQSTSTPDESPTTPSDPPPRDDVGRVIQPGFDPFGDFPTIDEGRDGIPEATTSEDPYGFRARDVAAQPPPSHKVNFLQRHGILARTDPTPCMTCHKDKDCLDCHQGAVRPGASHPPGYIVFHARQARTDPQSCTTCHTATRFCLDCHQAVRAGGAFGPQAARPQAGVRYHPESWLGQAPGPDHGSEARRNLWSCTSCHSGQDCVSCHTNVNPHPSGWLATCGPLLRRDPRSCTHCHADLNRIQRSCRP